MLKSIFGKQFRLHSFSLILISKYRVQEVSTCWNRLLHIHLVSVFHLDLKMWVLVFVSHQSRCIQLSSTLGITIKWYLLVHLQFFVNYLFCFVKRAQLSMRTEDVLCCLPCPGPCTLHGAERGERVPGLKADEYAHL